jgi:hypothetical protein
MNGVDANVRAAGSQVGMQLACPVRAFAGADDRDRSCAEEAGDGKWSEFSESGHHWEFLA